MSRRLSDRLLLVLAAGLVAIFAAEIGVRQFFELPTLQRLERDSDARAVGHARAAMDQEVAGLERRLNDYAVWDATYDFMARDPADPRSRYYAKNEVAGSAHQNAEINGVLLLGMDGAVRLNTYFDYRTGLPVNGRQLDPGSLDPAARSPHPRGGADIVASGLVSSNLGNLMFAASLVRDTSDSLPPRGVMLFWKNLDEKLFAKISQEAGLQLRFLPMSLVAHAPDLAARLGTISQGSSGFLPRDAQGMLYWTLADFTGRPLYLVRQAAAPRAFDDGWISKSTLFGFIASGIVLLLVTVIFSRWFVGRVARATAVMHRIREGGNYGEAIPVDGNDELSEMFAHFNALLRHIEEQEQGLKQQNQQLAEMSQRDPLTGIHNRRFMDQTFDRCWRQAARSARPISVLLIDVDFFKSFNDNYGHQSGDRVLRQVAQALQDNLHRATDYVARYGGEEFCVILTDTEPGDALLVAEGLRSAVQDLQIRHGHSGCADVVTVSIGAASTTADAKVIHLDLLRRADEALYYAKGAGRNRVAMNSQEGVRLHASREYN